MNINELSMDFSIRGRFVTKIIRMIQKSNDEEEKKYITKCFEVRNAMSLRRRGEFK